METETIIRELTEQISWLTRKVTALESQVNSPNEGTTYLSEQVASRFGLKKQTLYRKMIRGHIPQGKIWRYSPDNRVVVDTQALQDWLYSAPQVRG